MSAQFCRCLSIMMCFGGLACVAAASDSAIEYVTVPAKLVTVPQNLLKLAHAEEVHKELGLSPAQLLEWEKTLRAIDLIWWPSRIQPVSEQRDVVATLEERLISQAEPLVGKDAIQRFRQIELQSQGSRILARPDVEQYLALDAKQRKKLATIFAENDRLAAEVASAKSKVDAEKLRAVSRAQETEIKKALAVLTPLQAERIHAALGSPIETAKFRRIYPFAPELIDSGYWSLSENPTLESLRGQVVLVHFYAFQCHNCVANFGHYKRWDETLKKRGVRVIGIQTPETSAERDPEKVINAARNAGFQFPVLIDLASKNWAAWGNTMWPTVYVIDKKGYIRFWWQGELNWQGATVDKEIEKVIDQLLDDLDEK